MSAVIVVEDMTGMGHHWVSFLKRFPSRKCRINCEEFRDVGVLLFGLSQNWGSHGVFSIQSLVRLCGRSSPLNLAGSPRGLAGMGVLPCT